MRQSLYRTEYEKVEDNIQKLDYFILEDELYPSYGIGIRTHITNENTKPIYETAICENITPNASEIIAILSWLADNRAQPVHLHDLIEDYLSGTMEPIALSQTA